MQVTQKTRTQPLPLFPMKAYQRRLSGAYRSDSADSGCSVQNLSASRASVHLPTACPRSVRELVANGGKTCKLWKSWWTESCSLCSPKAFQSQHFRQANSADAVNQVPTFGTEG